MIPFKTSKFLCKSAPFTEIFPALSFESKPLIAFMSVVFPAPEPPIMATNSFSPILRLTSFKIFLPFPTFFSI